MDTWDGRCLYLKLLVVMVAAICYMLQTLGYWHKWDTTCRNDWALHYWKCMEKTDKCYALFNGAKMFYCTPHDMELENEKFCTSGYCDENTNYCRDDQFQPRVTEFATKWKDCMFEPERNNPCTQALSGGQNGYDSCVLGVEIFLFVFLVKDMLIDTIIAGCDEKWGVSRGPAPYWIVTKVIIISSAIGGWGFWLRSAGNLMGEDMIDLMYVVLFIGSRDLLEVIKLVISQKPTFFSNQKNSSDCRTSTQRVSKLSKARL